MSQDLAPYERRGEVDAEHALAASDHRRQRTAVDIAEHARHAAAQASPLPRHVLERVAELLSVKTPPHQLMRWRLRLYCGHAVERSAHASHKTVHDAFMGGRLCEVCGKPSTIVAAEAVGLVAAPPQARQRQSRADERGSLERRLAKLEQQAAEIRGQLSSLDD